MSPSNSAWEPKWACDTSPIAVHAASASPSPRSSTHCSTASDDSSSRSADSVVTVPPDWASCTRVSRAASAAGSAGPTVVPRSSSSRVVPATATTTMAAAATTASTRVGGASEGGRHHRERPIELDHRRLAPSRRTVAAPRRGCGRGSGRAPSASRAVSRRAQKSSSWAGIGSSWRAVRTNPSGSTSGPGPSSLTAPPPPGCGGARRGRDAGGRRPCRGRRRGSWRPPGGRSLRRRRARR